jgi:hypothetical protein
MVTVAVMVIAASQTCGEYFMSGVYRFVGEKMSFQKASVAVGTKDFHSGLGLARVRLWWFHLTIAARLMDRSAV